YFFFQAEDGIRDRNVTGVQTCALPIWPARSGGSLCAGSGPLAARGPGVVDALPAYGGCGAQPTHPVRTGGPIVRTVAGWASLLRSEERRVGKEGRTW